jgi:hypothetical protein
MWATLQLYALQNTSQYKSTKILAKQRIWSRVIDYVALAKRGIYQCWRNSNQSIRKRSVPHETGITTSSDFGAGAQRDCPAAMTDKKEF